MVLSQPLVDVANNTTRPPPKGRFLRQDVRTHPYWNYTDVSVKLNKKTILYDQSSILVNIHARFISPWFPSFFGCKSLCLGKCDTRGRYGYHPTHRSCG